MNEEQYSRANKRVLLAIVVVFGYIAVTLMLPLQRSVAADHMSMFQRLCSIGQSRNNLSSSTVS